MEIAKKFDFIYEIPKQGKWNVPALAITDEKMLETIKKDKTLET
jgi:hypothetical protein